MSARGSGPSRGSRKPNNRSGSGRSGGPSNRSGSGRGKPAGKGSGSSRDSGNKAGGNRGRSSSRDRNGRNDRRGGYRDRNERNDRNDRRSGSRDDRPRTSTKGAHAARRGDEERPPTRAETSGWGSVAKHGAVGATIGQRRDEEDAAERFSPEERRRFQERQAKRDAVAARNADLRSQAQQAIDRGGLPAPAENTKASKPTVERRPLPGRPPNPMDVPKEMARIVGKPKGERSWKLFKRAAREFENEQYGDARKTMKPLTQTFPGIADLHELYGLSLYRLGKWQDAVAVLEEFRQLSGTTEQNPVLMDCHRALGNWADVEELWGELGEHSPSPELMAEGRIVMAGAEADRGRIDAGIRLLEKGWKAPREPQAHHLRRAYALADLLERDGKLPRSRKLFGWIDAKAPGYLDAGERANA